MVVETDAQRAARKKHESESYVAGIRATLEKGREADAEHNRVPEPKVVRSKVDYAREVAQSILDAHKVHTKEGELVALTDDGGHISLDEIHAKSAEIAVQSEDAEIPEEVVPAEQPTDGESEAEEEVPEEAPVEVEAETVENVTDTAVLDEIERQIAELEARKKALKEVQGQISHPNTTVVVSAYLLVYQYPGAPLERDVHHIPKSGVLCENELNNTYGSGSGLMTGPVPRVRR